MNGAAASLGLCSAILLCACSTTPTHDLVVQLRTDLLAGPEFSAVELTVFPVDESGSAKRVFLDADPAGYFEVRRLTELVDLGPDSYRLGLSLLDDDGSSLIERPVLLQLQESTAVTVRIQRSCLNVACPRDMACFAGECVDLRCSAESPEFCGDATQCADNADCKAAAICAEVRCDDRLCWAEPKASDDPDACPAELYCSAEQGCLRQGSASTSPSCDDGVRNGDELFVDCGGSCPPCQHVASTTVDAHCRNGLEDEDETGVDCGGSCAPCSETFDCTTQSAVPVHECVALVALYDATNGPNWNQIDWGQNSDICSWRSLTCADGHITEFSRTINFMEGSLPPALANLTELTVFAAEKNLLNGTLPPELGRLTKLRVLELDGNFIEGSIPPELGNMSAVETMDLFRNRLRGAVPAALADLPSLNRLLINRNACLWAEECDTLLPLLEREDPEWRSLNQDPECVPPEQACP